MNQTDIKNLEKELWDAADELRGNSKLTAAEYKDPLLGLVLLRFAQNRYEDAKIQIDKNLPVNPRTGKKREANKDDFAAAGAILLNEKSKYDYLAALPEGEDIAQAINNAMKLIEDEYKDLEGILPKSYQEFDDKLLRDLVRVFNKDAVKKAKGDVFGRIYEFFLMKFSMQGAGAQEGGEFFTPPSLVNLIVNFIQPNHGIIHDPACGSGGMFVQTAHFIQDHENKSVNEAITVYGTELKSNNTKLAKMNLAIHGIEGKIIESNSFYTNPHNLTGKCDFVMANPPFNVDKIDAKNKFLAEDNRLPFGAPLTGKGTISNGNYLWMQYFHSYLNATGRAGFVMASSATDAGNAEKLIRQKLIETGDVECIVSISNNFFYTRSLPCHVWFFNKDKKKENKDKILMIDARNTFRKVSTTINDFSDEHLEGLTALINAFRNNNVTLSAVEGSHKENEPALSLSNEWLQTHFPNNNYQNVEGLCKIVDLAEVIEQDYSLTPGRYVGVNIEIDMDFDYKTRMTEIHTELAALNTEATTLMNQIQSVNL
ncbi:MAG: SAM-dependent DNA methyltransferase [Lutibacter sp.]|nr:SAM-dependent DNA methyltransferase [Lutibacter sp.]